MSNMWGKCVLGATVPMLLAVAVLNLAACDGESDAHDTLVQQPEDSQGDSFAEGDVNADSKTEDSYPMLDGAEVPDTAEVPETAEVPDTGDLSGLPLAAPEGVVVTAGRVFVTNANGVWNAEANKMEYGPGYLTVLAESDLAWVGQVVLNCTNPQYILAEADSVYVVCSGVVAMDENWVMTPTEAGKLIRVNAETLKVEKALELPIGSPSPMVGFPGSFCHDSETGRFFVGAATGPFVYVVEEAMEEIAQIAELYEMAGANDSITIECSEGTVWAASFNSGDLYTLSALSLAKEKVTSITETDQLEGPTDLMKMGGNLYVLNTISSKVAVVDLTTDAVVFPIVTGAAPNRLAQFEEALFVVNSTDNNLTRYDTMSGTTQTPFGAMDPGTNPWEMGVSDGFGFVTGYMSNTVMKINLSSGDVVVSVGN